MGPEDSQLPADRRRTTAILFGCKRGNGRGWSVDHLDRRQPLEHCRRRQSWRLYHGAVLQGHSQTVSQKCNRHRRVGAMLQMAIDGLDSQFALQRAKSALDLAELHIRSRNASIICAESRPTRQFQNPRGGVEAHQWRAQWPLRIHCCASSRRILRFAVAANCLAPEQGKAQLPFTRRVRSEIMHSGHASSLCRSRRAVQDLASALEDLAVITDSKRAISKDIPASRTSHLALEA
jgi:hypothetical protein